MVTLSFHRFDGPTDRVWVLWQMLAARPAMRRAVGSGFWKMMGSGTGEGFTPVPNPGVYALLATWPDGSSAREAMDGAPFRAYAERARESWTVFLEPYQVRGSWSGRRPFEAGGGASDKPLAALTRATVRFGALARFWRQVPDISRRIGDDPSVLFKIGVGDVPWLHQVTFSIWPDQGSMAAFARRDGPHARAIRAVREGGWFREELYARFRVVGDAGAWGGSSPLARIGAAA